MEIRGKIHFSGCHFFVPSQTGTPVALSLLMTMFTSNKTDEWVSLSNDLAVVKVGAKYHLFSTSSIY